VLKRPNDAERLVHMPGRVEHRVKHVPHSPRRVDDVGYSPGHEAEQRPGPVKLAYHALLVAQEDKRQLMLLGKTLMRRLAVRTDADDLGPRLLEDEVAITERTRLSRAALGVVFRIEVQDNRAVAEQVAEANGAARPVGQREVGSAGAGLELPGGGRLCTYYLHSSSYESCRAE